MTLRSILTIATVVFFLLTAAFIAATAVSGVEDNYGSLPQWQDDEEAV
jgi:hypothetical protein